MDDSLDAKAWFSNSKKVGKRVVLAERTGLRNLGILNDIDI